MSWRSWIVLSLAWETSLSLVSAMAVNNRGSVLDVNTKTDPDCGTCNLDQRDDTTLYDQCNFWGDPHVTRRFGTLQGKDYQGGGVQNVTRTTDDCNQLEMQAFHCQYKKSQNNVMLGALVQVTVSGTEVKIYIKPTPSGLSVEVSPLSVVTVTLSSNNKSVTIESPDECLYVYIDLKTISVAPKYILNMKSRVLKELPIIGPDGGYCGAEPPNTASVTDNSTWLFTEEQFLELCDLCSAGGAEVIPPGCPGAGPPAGAPRGLDRCSFAEAVVADNDNPIKFECTGRVEDRANDAGVSDPPREPNATTNECVFGYNSPGGSANEVTCDEMCGLVGGTCSGRLEGNQNCNGGPGDEDGPDDIVDGNLCNDPRNNGACYCEFPDSQVQQEGPTVETLLDQNGVTDPDDRERELTAVKNQCTENETNALQGTQYPPVDPNNPTENELVLEGCIKDILSLGPSEDRNPDDEGTAVDTAEDFEENQPSGDGCSSFSCPGDRPAITPAPSCNGECTAEKCCVPTCGSTSDVCSGEGVTPDTNLNSTPCGDLRGGNCTADTCCSKTCADFDCGVNALRQPPPSCGPAGTPCNDTLCCEATCASHVCTKDGFVLNETAKTEVCTGSICGDDQCCQPTCSSFDCPANFVKNLPKNPELCPNGKCDKVFCCEPTCASYIKCAQNGFVPDDSKNDVVCSGGTCDDATCCQPTCLSYEKCKQQGFVKDSAKDCKTCLPGGCDDITCCEATCATYKHCRERRAEPDPKKATLVCGLTANKCNDDLCCEKRGQLRRNERREYREGRRNGHYGHDAYEPGAAKLIDTEELAFLQESNFVDEDEEEESEEL